MYVFVTVAELTGPEKQVVLGEVAEDVTLEALLAECIKRIDKFLPEQSRDMSRHFWHNDHLLPFERSYLRDIATTVNVTLELRLDYYRVELPREAAARYAINPELTCAEAIDLLLNKSGASRCHEILPRNGQALLEQKSLMQQETLPYHARLSTQETELVVRRKPQILWWSVLLLLGFTATGLVIGIMIARLR